MQRSTYYDILGLAQDATSEQVRRAYVLRLHNITGRGKEPPDAQEQFFRLRHAYEVLDDPVRRSRYNARLRDASFQSMIDKATSADGSDSYARPHQPAAAEGPVYRDPMQVALNVYHLPWREFSTYPLPVRLRKLSVTVAFRVFYAGLGACLGLLIAISFGHPIGGGDVVQGYNPYAMFAVVYRNASLALALLFLVFGKVLSFRRLCKMFDFPKDP